MLLCTELLRCWCPGYRCSTTAKPEHIAQPALSPDEHPSYWAHSSSQTPVTQDTHPPHPCSTQGVPYQSTGTTPLFFMVRSTTDGGALMGAAPKLKSSFKGVRTGGVWLVLSESRGMNSELRTAQGVPPWQLACLPCCWLGHSILEG